LLSGVQNEAKSSVRVSQSAAVLLVFTSPSL